MDKNKNNFSSPEGVSLKEYINDKIDNLEKSIDTRFQGVSITTNAALASADKATLKAEIATEERFRGVNEFRQTLSDQAAKFIIRTEFELVVNRLEQDIKNLVEARAELLQKSVYDTTYKNLAEQVDDLRINKALLEGKASQSSVYIAYAFSIIGIIMGVISLLR